VLSIVSLLIIITLSILITRIATVALTQTGLSKESARFQARSAFTGVGFTTDESEKVVNHPVRRRILLILMLLGNAGFVTAVTSLILGFVDPENKGSETLKILLLVSGLVLLWAIAVSGWVDKRLSLLISWALERYSDLDTRDYSSLLRLTGEYGVSELQIKESDWICNRRLQDSKLRDEGIIVLGIIRSGGKYLGAPKGDTEIRPDDTLIIYGRSKALENLDCRNKGRDGDEAHEAAKKEQKEVMQKEKEEDEAGAG
jgi:hypothetical protein